MNYKLRDTFLEDGFYVTQNYMARRDYYAQFNLLGHEGVDFGHSDKKRQVRSPLTGTVFIAYDKNYGNYAVVEDYKQQCAVYLCHLENVVVVSGEEVTAGDPIGEMGQSGNSTGEHCHCNFLILQDGSNKYRAKKWNWGYLDLMYPRDTGETVKFDGVEDYSITWGSGTTPESTQLSECEIHKNNLQNQVNGLLKDIEAQKGVISDTETKLGTANGRIQELTKQNEDLSQQLGSTNSTIKALTDKVQSLNNVVGEYQKEDAVQISQLKEAYDRETIANTARFLGVKELRAELKLSSTIDNIDDAENEAITAVQSLYQTNVSLQTKVKDLEAQAKKLTTQSKHIDKLSIKEVIIILIDKIKEKYGKK